MNMSPHICLQLVTILSPMSSDRDSTPLTSQIENIIFVLMSIIGVKHDYAFFLHH